MRTTTKQLFFPIISAIISSPLMLADITIDVIKSKNYTPSVKDENQIVEIIKTVFDTNEKTSPYCKIMVHVVTDDSRMPQYLSAYQKPQYLIAYLLSNTDLSYQRTRLDIDEGFCLRGVTYNYSVTKRERQLLYEEREPQCPDSAVVFFGVTPIGFMPSCYEAILHADLFAQQHKLKSFKILNAKEATVQAYKDWLSCPNLKGYFTVTHGNKEGIACGNGDIEYPFFNSLPSNYLKGKVLYFNCCLVHNDPFLASIVGKGVQRFIGGIPELKIGPSESVAKCFWNIAFDKKAMTPTLKDCERQNYPKQGDHGISGTGSDIFGEE